jgi:putative DNA primase/helicase
LIGGGGTGKGTTAQVMQALHRQTVALSLDALDGFRLASLQSASLVLVDETPQRIDEQKLKTLISGDAIQCDIKYRDPLTIRPTAKWIVNGNALPAISDHSSGFWRRWLIFPFNVVPTHKIPLLAETIVDNELSGVLNWCVAGLVRLLKREQFPPLPDEMAQAAAAGKQSSNNVAEWVVDCGIVTDEKCRNSRRVIYSLYSEWCGESGTRAVSAKKFWERVIEALPGIKFDRSAGGERTRMVNIPLPPGSGR